MPQHGSPSGLPLILACVNARRRQRLAAALEADACLAFHASFEALAADAATARARIVILGCRDEMGRDASRVVAALSRGGSPAIVAYASSDEIAAGAIKSPAIADLIVADATDAPAFVRALVFRLLGMACAERVIAALRGRLKAPIAAIAETAVRDPSCATVEAIAGRLGVQRQTMAAWCRKERMPTPEEIIVWSRLLLVAALLEESPRSLNSLAISLDFPSVISLRNQLKRYIGLTALQIREAGLDVALARFDAALANHAVIQRTPVVAGQTTPLIAFSGRA